MTHLAYVTAVITKTNLNPYNTVGSILSVVGCHSYDPEKGIFCKIISPQARTLLNKNSSLFARNAICSGGSAELAATEEIKPVEIKI